MKIYVERIILDRLYAYAHQTIDVLFNKNSDNFVVEEIPLYKFSQKGEHLVFKLRKKDTTTWEALKVLSEFCGAKIRDFGYAGLKDKDGFTTQYISIHKNFESKIDSFNHNKIKIVEKIYHKNKIKIGHLKGNRFFIKLKKVNPTQAKIIKEVTKNISNYGIPNYFGYQRFGRDKNNFEIGKAILEEKRKEKNKKLKKFFISAYQSHLFNLWLSKRVEISRLFNSLSHRELFELFNYPKDLIKLIKKQKNYFKLLPGDRLSHYPYGKIFLCEDLESESERFFQKNITVTGLLVGKKTPKAEGLAGNLEKNFSKDANSFEDKIDGSRRFAWVFPKDLKTTYKEEKAWFELNFELPKGSYATEFISELLHKQLT
jgi:tRNA pseudouridine13 synthase